MHLITRASGLTILALAAAGAFSGGCRNIRKIDQYNEWKLRCYELSDFYREKLHDNVPYHMIANHEADRCASPDTEAFRWDADKRNLHVLLAITLYHYDLDVRGRALDLLQLYHCENDHTCGEIAAVLDAHIAASLPLQPRGWKERYHQRTRDYYRFVLALSRGH